MKVHYSGFGYVGVYDHETGEVWESIPFTLEKYSGTLFLFDDNRRDLEILGKSDIGALFIGEFTHHSPVFKKDFYHHDDKQAIHWLRISDKDGNQINITMLNDGAVYESNGNIIRVIPESEKSEIIEEMTTPTNAPPMAEYLNPKHPMYSPELVAAIETWETVLKNNPERPKRGSRKALIEKHLNDNYPNFSGEAKKRIAGILNPDKAGGVTKTE